MGSGAAPDGTYALVLSGEDRAGNRTTTNALRVIKDGRTPSVALTVDGEYLSPLSSGAEHRSRSGTRISKGWKAAGAV